MNLQVANPRDNARPKAVAPSCPQGPVGSTRRTTLAQPLAALVARSGAHERLAGKRFGGCAIGALRLPRWRPAASSEACWFGGYFPPAPHPQRAASTKKGAPIRKRPSAITRQRESSDRRLATPRLPRQKNPQQSQTTPRPPYQTSASVPQSPPSPSCRRSDQPRAPAPSHGRHRSRS